MRIIAKRITELSASARPGRLINCSVHALVDMWFSDSPAGQIRPTVCLELAVYPGEIAARRVA